MMAEHEIVWPVQVMMTEHGGLRPQCEVCQTVAWDGPPFRHTDGCLLVAELVRGVRAGGIDFQKEVRKLLAILEDDGA